MADREKVIMSLETAVKNFERYSGDEYGREYDYARVEVETLEAALALLKAQEPVKPIENAGFYYCGACRYVFTSARQNYCSECGRAVKWI